MHRGYEELLAPLLVAGVLLGFATLTGSKLVVIVVASALGGFFFIGRLLERHDRQRAGREK